jgi:hypothetical protein
MKLFGFWCEFLLVSKRIGTNLYNFGESDETISFKTRGGLNYIVASERIRTFFMV